MKKLRKLVVEICTLLKTKIDLKDMQSVSQTYIILYTVHYILNYYYLCLS